MFEWDERARQDNLSDHDVDFVRAARMFENPVLEREDNRQFTGERRRIAIGHVNGFFLVVVSTLRGKSRRIISAWRAGPDDERLYRAAVPQPVPPNAGLHPGGRALPRQSRPGLLVLGKAPLPLPWPQGRSDTSGS
jgi:uncharacterized DUF497 family protein